MQRDERGIAPFHASTPPPDGGQEIFQLGMSCITGASVDLISAHKWFNVAAMLGHCDATRLRREIAAEMSEAEITAAQRAARAWITRH
ncbi:MAG TPA: hypothetical protein VFU97_21510 [Xanthobacteraceae bacterium]|jgi:uncharacterized protein|nr:hypothetical protein [Xanthobacteraceae bacterium]